MNTSPPLDFKQVRFGYRRSLDAVRDATFTLPEGSVTALLGPNGSGKTTLLKLCMNLLRPQSGEIRIWGRPSTLINPEWQRQIGYVSENQELPLWMDLAELMKLSRGLYPTWDVGYADSLRGKMDLPDNVPLKQFSRGMRAKATFLISLAYRPKLLVLDEPFSGLDIITREELMSAILDCTKQNEWSVIVSSHEVDEIEKLADRVVFLRAGRVAETDTLDDLQHRTKRLQVTLAEETLVPVPSHPALSHWKQEARFATAMMSGCQSSTLEDSLRATLPTGSSFALETLNLRELYVHINRRA